jgi:hypothetical protein
VPLVDATDCVLVVIDAQPGFSAADSPRPTALRRPARSTARRG